MNKFSTLIGAALMMGVAGQVSTATAADAEYTLVISSWTPPGAAMNSIMWPNLTKMIEEATDGRVTTELKIGLAPPPAQFDIVQDQAADLSWIFHGYNPGRFVTPTMLELPGYDASSETLSVAYWHAYENYFAKANEYQGVKLIGLMVHGPGQMNSSAQVETLEQMKDLKVRVGGGVSSMVAEAVGAKGISVPSPKLYETLASHAADATLSPIESRKSFNLTEVTKNVYVMPGGFYRGTFALIMNQEKFDSLPADIQEALDGVFGEAASRMAGKVWDEIDEDGWEATRSAGDNVIVEASQADQESFAAIAANVRKQVLENVSATGVDANAAFEAIQSEIGAAQ